jgi:ribosomal protein S17E
MSYKPDEGTLMAYLYGELDAAETKKVKEYLNAHPEELKHLQQLAAVQDVLKQVQEKEVIAPPIFGDLASKQVHFWQTGYFKTMMSIAASFILILVAARLIGPEITYSGGELRISFNGGQQKTEQVIQPAQPLLTAAEVQAMINSSLHKNNEVISAGWEDNQRKMDESIKTNFATNSKKLDELMKVTSQASQDQVRTFVASLQEDNLKLMKDYMQLSSKEQKTYVEALLVDFSKYLQEQRKQDFQVFQTRMSSIEKNTDQFKQETEQILASIISNPDATIRKVNNY